MELRKQGIIPESRTRNTLADSSEGLRSMADAGFILRRKKN
jgi:hypothetical protein